MCLPFHHTGRREYFSTEWRARQGWKSGLDAETGESPVFGTAWRPGG
nr:MAG TPA: hypothetical protein [Caudoviricetes sp.]